MEKLLGGADGLAARAPRGSIQAKAYSFLSSKVKVRGLFGWLVGLHFLASCLPIRQRSNKGHQQHLDVLTHRPLRSATVF